MPWQGTWRSSGARVVWGWTQWPQGPSLAQRDTVDWVRAVMCEAKFECAYFFFTFNFILFFFQVVHMPRQQGLSAASHCKEPAIRRRLHMRFFSWPAALLHTSLERYWSPTEGRGSPRPMTWSGCLVLSHLALQNYEQTAPHTGVCAWGRRCVFARYKDLK